MVLEENALETIVQSDVVLRRRGAVLEDHGGWFAMQLKKKKKLEMEGKLRRRGE